MYEVRTVAPWQVLPGVAGFRDHLRLAGGTAWGRIASTFKKKLLHLIGTGCERRSQAACALRMPFTPGWGLLGSCRR